MTPAPFAATAARPRALFVTPVSAKSGASGAQQRSRAMLEALQDAFDVDVLQLAEAATSAVGPPETDAAGRRSVDAGARSPASPFARFVPQPALTRDIEAALGLPMAGYDLIVGRYLWPVCQLSIPRGTRVLIDLDDWHYRYAAPVPASFAVLRERLVKAFAHRLARRQLRRFSAAFCVGSRDRDEIARRIDGGVYFLPNIAVAAPAAVGPPPAGRRLLFVGSLWYRPNAEGVDWFLHNVWPRVRRALPDASVRLAGAASASERARWERHPAVSAPGFVDDLDRAYAEATAVIAPIRTGGGTNIKVLEAMAHGRPAVVTGFIQRAFGDLLQADRHFLVADAPRPFADAVVQALQRGDGLAGMVRNAREAVRDVFGPQRFKATVLAAADATIARGPAR